MLWGRTARRVLDGAEVVQVRELPAQLVLERAQLLPGAVLLDEVLVPQPRGLRWRRHAQMPPRLPA